MKTNVIPVTVVDDFFEQPKFWTELANTCEYSPDKNGKWPGVRSRALYEINQAAFDTLTKQFFSLYYNLRNDTVGWQVQAYFQRIPKNYTEGWVHYDTNLISGIVYLSPDANVDSGTSLYTPNKICQTINTDIKHREYLGQAHLSESDTARRENNSQFTELVRVQNVYNRLVAFDCNIAHSAHFNTTDSERLTLVFFVEKLHTEFTPIQRMRSNTQR